MEGLAIREAKGEDVQQGSELIVRMKRLNGEFDPLFKVVDGVEKSAMKYLTDSIDSKEGLVIVAAKGKKVIGILRAHIADRIFYEPTKEGMITDFYILPEGRRKSLGNEMLEYAAKRLKQMGAEMITAEFPAQNEIALKFYHKSGFRGLVNTQAREERGQ